MVVEEVAVEAVVAVEEAVAEVAVEAVEVVMVVEEAAVEAVVEAAEVLVVVEEAVEVLVVEEEDQKEELKLLLKDIDTKVSSLLKVRKMLFLQEI